MAKGQYTRKEAELLAYQEVTGRALSHARTVGEIKARVEALPEDLRRRCHQLYLQNMSINRPGYYERYIEQRSRRLTQKKRMWIINDPEFGLKLDTLQLNRQKSIEACILEGATWNYMRQKLGFRCEKVEVQIQIIRKPIATAQPTNTR